MTATSFIFAIAEFFSFVQTEFQFLFIVGAIGMYHCNNRKSRECGYLLNLASDELQKQQKPLIAIVLLSLRCERTPATLLVYPAFTYAHYSYGQKHFNMNTNRGSIDFKFHRNSTRFSMINNIGNATTEYLIENIEIATPSIC